MDLNYFTNMVVLVDHHYIRHYIGYIQDYFTRYSIYNSEESSCSSNLFIIEVDLYNIFLQPFLFTSVVQRTSLAKTANYNHDAEDKTNGYHRNTKAA